MSAEDTKVGEILYKGLKELALSEYVGISVIMCAIVWLRLAAKKNPPSDFFLLIIISYCVGILIRYLDYPVGIFDKIPSRWVSMCFYLCGPLFLYYSSLCLDFSENCFNSAVTILGLSVFSIVVAFAGTYIAWPFLHFSSDMTFYSTLVLMLCLTPKWVVNAVSELDGVQGHIRDIQMLLKCEQFCSTAVAYILSQFIIQMEYLKKWPKYTMYQLVILVAHQGIGLIIGIIFGIFVSVPLRFAYNDIVAQTTLMISSLLLVKFCGVIINTNHGLAICVFGLILNSNKVKMSKDAEEFHIELWEWYIYLAKTTMFIVTGLSLGLKRPGTIGIHHYGVIIFIYCCLLALRLIGFTLCRMFFVSQQRGMHWKHVLIIGLGPFNGAPCLVTAVSFTIYDEVLGYQNLTYIVCVCALSIFLNATLFKYVLNVLGMFEYKREAIVNMNIAVGQISICRDRAIFSQRMDMVISDANWGIVENLTRLPHPYRSRMRETGYYEDRGDFRMRTIMCSQCGIEIVAPPTKGEIEDMITEAIQRVLKIQLVSFGQQYENGSISRHSYRTLFSVIDTAANSGSPAIDSTPLKISTEESKVTRFFRNIFYYLITVTSSTYNFVPENVFRLIAFRLTTSRIFNITMAVLALIDTGIICNLLIIWYFADTQNGYKEFHDDDHLHFGKFAQYADIMFFFIFTTEFIIQILGLGVYQYFASHINKIEAGINLVRTTELVLYLHSAIQKGSLISVLLTDEIIILMKFLLLLRAQRVYVFIVRWFPKCMSLVEKQIEDELMKNYEVGKGYLVSLDRVMKFLNHVAIYQSVYDAVKEAVELERKKVAKALGCIQKQYPSIAITLKTRHAIRLVINSVSECINDLKEDGILDLNESKDVNDSLEKVKNDLRELPMVDPSLAQSVIKDITWLNLDKKQSEVISQYAKLTSYDYNDQIILNGDDPIGLYVLVSGLVKAYYHPTPKTIHLNSTFGVLPNYDFFDVIKFDQAQDSYVVAGNVIGEIGAVSGRRYDMSVICETSVQLYFVPWGVIKEVVHDSEKSIEIQNEIWKSIGVRIAVVLVQSKPSFCEWPKEKLLAYLDKGWVPSLARIKCINIVEEILDMILIEGVCKDSATNTVFIGPCHLPRGIRLLYLPEHPKWDFETVYETKIMFVSPAHDFTHIQEQMFVQHHDIEATTETVTKEIKVGFINPTD